jgi:hypothetical protein
MHVYIPLLPNRQSRVYYLQKLETEKNTGTKRYGTISLRNT